MAKGTREIRRKIKSITATKQITKAMELVAASKMRRAVEATLVTRPYASLARIILTRLADSTNPKLHPLLAKRDVNRVLIIFMSTDKGMCGGLNTQLFRAAAEYLKKARALAPDRKFSFAAIGKKGGDFLRRLGEEIVAAYPAMSVRPSMKDIFPVARMAIEDFIAEKADKVMLIYTDFVSAVSQKPVVRRLLPFSKPALEEMIEGLETPAQRKSTPQAQTEGIEYLFEPSPDRVLNILLPRLTEMQVYQAALEAAASEHSARMFAMRNATDNATELIQDLTLTYNSIRQAGITAELAEISAGRAVSG